MNKISIIIPIFNVENYLSQCLESVISQTYKNLEIILINDGSTDSSGEICDSYALKDNRIKVIHQKNGGLSDARNSGLRNFTGDLVSFVDSDDFIAPNFCELMLENLTKLNAEIVECYFAKFENEVELKNLNLKIENKVEIFETEPALELLMKEYFKQIVWNKIYKKEVIKDLYFPVGKINEDEYYTYKAFGNANKIIKINDISYFYRQQEHSIMGKSYNLKRLDGLLALEERINYMKENFPQLENLAIKKFSLGSLWHYQQVDKNPAIDPEELYRKKIVNKVKTYNKLSIFKHWNVKEVFWYQFFIITPNFCVKFRNYIKVGI